MREKELTNCVGATVIIVSLTSYVSAMANTCKKLLPIPNFPKNIVEAVGMHGHSDLMVSSNDFCSFYQLLTVSFSFHIHLQGQLYNGIEILIITPAYFRQLIDMCKFLLSGDRLKVIVFENLDLIYERHSEITEYIVKRVRRLKNIQVIVTSNTWRPILRRLMTPYTVTIIGNSQEAAIYALSDISLDIVTDNKLNNLCGEHHFVTL